MPALPPSRTSWDPRHRSPCARPWEADGAEGGGGGGGRNRKIRRLEAATAEWNRASTLTSVAWRVSARRKAHPEAVKLIGCAGDQAKRSAGSRRGVFERSASNRLDKARRGANNRYSWARHNGDNAGEDACATGRGGRPVGIALTAHHGILLCAPREYRALCAIKRRERDASCLPIALISHHRVLLRPRSERPVVCAMKRRQRGASCLHQRLRY
eukprot:7391861-Prymnesium_polylepis.2